MALVPLDFQPGFIKDTTDYAASGFWIDGSLVRFRGKYPESWGGWTRFSDNTFVGNCRYLYQFSVLNGNVYLAYGTSKYFYIDQGGTQVELTPLRLSASLSTDPIETTGGSGSGIITITHTSHNAAIGDIVLISGATAVDGITADEINTYHTIETVPTGNTYTIDTGGSATTGSITGGGASVVADYILSFGADGSGLGAGWSADTWGSDEWGVASDISALPGGGLQAIWSIQSYGAEDLIINPRNQQMYYWDATTPTTRAVALSTLGGASNTPVVVTRTLVSAFDGHVIALGVNNIGSSTLDPMRVRWSDQESAAVWDVNTTTSAGNLILSKGSKIITGLQAGNDILIFTDAAIYAMTWVGGIFVFNFELIAENVDIAGPNAAVLFRDNVYWMGRGGFYRFTGNVTQVNDSIDINQIPNAIQDYIIRDCDWTKTDNIYCGTNKAYDEVIWFYTSKSSPNGQNDKYAVYNPTLDIWYYGALARDAWHDSGYNINPVAAGGGKLYYQEDGADDNSVSPPVPLNPYIESAPFNMMDGNSFIFASRILHDVEFIADDPTMQSVDVILKTKDYPGEQNQDTSTNSITRTAVLPVQAYTKQSHIRLRGRQMSLRMESNTASTRWRLGKPRVEMRPDGRQ